MFNYFIQVVAAVHFLHEHNLIHRDLKPENILIDENDHLFLLFPDAFQGLPHTLSMFYRCLKGVPIFQ